MKRFFYFFLLSTFLYGNSQKGDSAFQNGNYIEAIKYYKESSLKEDKYLHIKLAQAYTRLADNFFRIYNFKKAKYYYKKAIDLKGRLAKEKLAKLYEKEGDLYYKGKKFILALQSYRKSFTVGNKAAKRKITATSKRVKHQLSLAGDTRKIVTTTSPSWAKAIGRLITPTHLKRKKNRSAIQMAKCSATVVNFDEYESSKIIVTASHCIKHYDKKAGLIRFIIKTADNKMILRYATIYKDSHFDLKLLKKKSDYAILILSSPISRKAIKPVKVVATSFSKLQKKYKYHFASLAGFSSDIGDFGSELTYDPKCKIQYFNKLYGKSNCSAFKGASGGPVILTTSNDKKRAEFYLVGVVSHFRGNKYNHIYFAPEHIFYQSLKKAIETYNKK